MSFKNTLMIIAIGFVAAVTTQVHAEATVPGVVAVSTDTLSEARSADFAGDPDEGDGGGDVEAAVPYTGKGTHECYQAGTDFPLTCKVERGGFNNCPQASAFLQAMDCCPETKPGTYSFNFTLDSCSV